MKTAILILSVAVSGAAILALEILGTRILGPFYGVSLFLWSALIATTLIALSVGYVLGGQMADKRPTYERLSWLLVISGIWVTGIPLLRGPALAVCEPLGLRFAVILTALILFFFPLAILGMVTPLAVRLRASDLNVVGRSIGMLTALSTVAGVISALLTGFFFVPYLGVTTLTVAIGVALILTGVAGLAAARRGKAAIVAGAVSAVLILMTAADSRHDDTPGSLLTEVQSPFGELRVEDRDGSRLLLVDGIVHTQADTATWTSELEYVAVMDIPMYMFASPGDALVIGLGGGSMAKNLVTAGWSVDAVEIDPVIVRLAYELFGLRADDATVFTMDGRRYLQETSKTYGIILIDAFGSSSIPFHMASLEAFQHCRSRMTPDGVLAINIWTRGWNDPMVRHITATLRRVFPEVFVLPIAEPPDKLGNLVLIASPQTVALRKDVERDYWDPEYRFGPKYQRVHAWDNRFYPDLTGAEIITDDRNPVDVWSESIGYAARKEMHYR